MTHHHHEHHHDHDVKSELTFKEKLIKLLEHWTKHNRDHAATYQEWAEKAADNEMPEIGALLGEVHALSMRIDDMFQKAADTVR